MDENKEESVQPEAENPTSIEQESYEKSQDFTLDDLSPVEGGIGIDTSEFEGLKKKIEIVNRIQLDSIYGDGQTEVDGKVYKYGERLPAGKTIPTMVLKIETEPLTTIDTPDGKKEIRASELLPLKRKEDGSWGWSLHEKAKIQKLYKRLRLRPETNPKDLRGQMVMVISRPSKDGSDNTWLGIQI